MFRAGDKVMHAPSGEKWMLATDEEDGRVRWCGWPPGSALSSECTLVESASDEERLGMLRKVSYRMCPVMGDSPVRVARRQWLAHYSDRLSPQHSMYRALGERFENQAGVIQNIVEEGFGGASVITSRAGSIRSNHWHRTDSHALYVLSGSMLYFERGLHQEDILRPVLCQRGDLVFTGPRIVHTTVFLEETVLLSYSKLQRTHESHEQDVVREVLVTPEMMAELVPWVKWS